MLVYEDAEFYPDWTQYYSEGGGLLVLVVLACREVIGCVC